MNIENKGTNNQLKNLKAKFSFSKIFYCLWRIFLSIRRAVHKLRKAVRGRDGGSVMLGLGVTEGGLKFPIKVVRNLWMTPKSKLARIG